MWEILFFYFCDVHQHEVDLELREIVLSNRKCWPNLFSGVNVIGILEYMYRSFIGDWPTCKGTIGHYVRHDGRELAGMTELDIMCDGTIGHMHNGTTTTT